MMKKRFQELMEDINNAKTNGQVVTFIQVDGWVKAITGKITNVIVSEFETVIVINDKTEFYINEDDLIFIDDTQDKKYYGLKCENLAGWSLSIMFS